MTNVVHAKVNPNSDGSVTTVVRPSDWNADHTVTFAVAGDISTQAFGDAAAAGSSGKIPDAGHKHAFPAQSALYSQSSIGTADLAIANTETVVVSHVFATNELAAGQTWMFRAWATRAGTTSAAEIIRIRIGTTTLTGNIAATLTPPVSTLAVPISIEGTVTIRTDGGTGSALGSLERRQHLAAVTITSAINPLTATVVVDTTAANQRMELTFISSNASNTYTFRNAVMWRVT